MAQPTQAKEPGKRKEILLRVIIYGNSGVGKSHFLGTAIDDPRTTPVLYLDLEGGTETIESKVREVSIEELGEPQEGLIDVLRLRKWSDLQEVFDFLFNARHKTQRAVYNTLVVDSLTEVNYLSLRWAVAHDPKPVLDTEMPELRHYGKSNAQMRAMLRAFRDLEDLHVLLTCLPQLRGEDDKSIAQIKPSLTGKLADEVMALFSMVGYLRIAPGAKQEREVIFQPEGRVAAKERTEIHRRVVKLHEPTVGKLLDALQGGT